MSKTPEEIRNWQDGLTEVFRGPSGLIGERLLFLQQAEHNAEVDSVQACGGYVTIADSCFDFMIECLDLLAQPPGVYHVVRTPLLVASVSRLRASYVLNWKGYCFDAASLLRGIFENAIGLCADAHGWTDISSRFDTAGIDMTQPSLAISKKMHKLRQPREADVVARVYGATSGLSQSDQDEIAMLVKLMHSHVHQTEMHLVHLIAEVKQSKRPVSVLPSWDSHKESPPYPNISLFLAWSFVRLLAYAVPQSQRSPEWQTRYNAIDGALRFWFEGWDKPLSPAIIRLIDAKFVFAGEWPAPPPSP